MQAGFLTYELTCISNGLPRGISPSDLSGETGLSSKLSYGCRRLRIQQ